MEGFLVQISRCNQPQMMSEMMTKITSNNGLYRGIMYLYWPQTMRQNLKWKCETRVNDICPMWTNNQYTLICWKRCIVNLPFYIIYCKYNVAYLKFISYFSKLSVISLWVYIWICKSKLFKIQPFTGSVWNKPFKSNFLIISTKQNELNQETVQWLNNFSCFYFSFQGERNPESVFRHNILCSWGVVHSKPGEWVDIFIETLFLCKP